MQQHSLEFSQTLNPDFNVGGLDQGDPHKISAFELSMLCGSMVHPMSTFSINSDGTALSMEWVQEYPC